MTAETLLSLAERVENLVGPDWSVNNDIWLLVGEQMGSPWTARTIDPIKPSEVIAGSDMASAVPRFPEDAGGIAFSWRVPNFTASLDSAMSLVPEAYGFMIDGFASDWFADLDAGRRMQANAATPALALTAAALRARASEVQP